MPAQNVFEWTVEWHSPYTQPPDGKARILLRVRGERRVGNPEDIEQCWKANEGYSVYIRHVPPPVKRLGKEQLAKLRRGRLERRMREKYPLFAEEFIQAELKKKPGYYAGEVDEGREALLREAEIIA
jgi:hypothetical protein